MYAGGVQNNEICTGNKACIRAGIKEYHQYEKFNSETYENDIALLKLDTLLTGKPQISAISINSTLDPLLGIMNNLFDSESYQNNHFNPMLNVIFILLHFTFID